jgi:hypothetical protein
MDPTEAHVREHLSFRGYTDVVYEPDGKVPPDFRVNGTIAVEVRRLNQHDGEGEHGLEETRIPLAMRLSNLIRSTRSHSANKKWIGVELSRPLPQWAQVEQEAGRFLGDVDSGVCLPGSVCAVGNVRLEFQFQTQSDFGTFAVATLHDREWGGFVVAELLRNLPICIAEKSRKTAQYRVRYEQWWLALVDMIGYHLSPTDQSQLREAFAVQHDWRKIILINPHDAGDYFDLCG